MVVPDDIRPWLPGVLGAPYYYGGGGDIVTGSSVYPRGGRRGLTSYGYDCSGFVLDMWVTVGLIPPPGLANAFGVPSVGRRAVFIADACTVVPVSDVRPLDVEFYGAGYSHVRLVVAVTGGEPIGWGADHGGPGTLGDDPRARVCEYTSSKFWPSGFQSYARLKPAYYSSAWRGLMSVARRLGRGDDIPGVPAAVRDGVSKLLTRSWLVPAGGLDG